MGCRPGTTLRIRSSISAWLSVGTGGRLAVPDRGVFPPDCMPPPSARCSRQSNQPAFRRPAGELAAVAELELAEHRADVGLHGLDADEQLPGDLLVRVPPGDEAKHLA